MEGTARFLTKICGVRLSATISFVVLCTFFPQSAAGQVVISEFLYDAPGSDTDQEWVELFNTGASAVDLTKWKIADTSNHVLNVPPKNDGKGSISVPSGGYIILASNAATFIAQYPSVENVVDTTLSLSNTSGALSLVDEAGVTVDALSYTKDLGAAGDGNTLHRSALSGTTMHPASPSPGSGAFSVGGSATSSTETVTSTATTTQNTQSTSSTSPTNAAPVSSYVAPPLPQLFADGGDDRAVIVAADALFEGRAYNRSQEFVDKVRFMWNFGDGSTAEGPSVMHHFEYPGRYVVWLDIAHDKTAASDKIIVTAEPARLGFSVFTDGSIEIINNAGRDLDLSNWRVVNAGREFRLPEHSVILSGESLRISQKTLGFWSSMDATLRYPNGVIALNVGEDSPTSVPAPSSSSAVPAPLATSVPQRTVLAHIEPASPAEDLEERPAPEEVFTETVSESVAAAAVTTIGTPSSVWWLAVGALAFLVSLVVIFVRRLQKTEWDIIEEEGGNATELPR